MSQTVFRFGMVGGGPGSWIGVAHRHAAALDGRTQLVAGVFSSKHTKTLAQGKKLGVATDRCYATCADMVAGEQKIDPAQRMQFVVIVSPNGAHFAQLKQCISAGFHIICDKPLCNTLDQAEEVAKLCVTHKTLLCLTHTYSGYPMVREARDMVSRGALGDIRKVVVQYPQGWLEESKDEGAQPATVTSLVDVGTHAHHLISFVTGLTVERLVSDVSTFVPGGPRAPDDFNVLLRFTGGARGVLVASQSSTGEENNLRISVYGDKGAVYWEQDKCNDLIWTSRTAPTQTLTRGKDYLSEVAKASSRLPPGHPEGYLEAFANLYTDFADTLAGVLAGSIDPLDPASHTAPFPTVLYACRSLSFVEAVERSFKEEAWVDAKYSPPALQ